MSDYESPESEIDIKRGSDGDHEEGNQYEKLVDPNIGLTEQLFNACKDGDIDKVKTLVTEYEVNPRESREHDHGGTPLHTAASHKCHEIVVFLIEKQGCDPKEVNKYGHNVLHRAVRAGDLKTVEYLVKRGIDPMSTCLQGRTALHHACMRSCLDIVKYFMDEKLDFSCRDRMYSLTPLDLACEHGSLELVKYLIENHKCDIKFRKDGHNTPLHLAVYGGKRDIVEYLIDTRGYSPNIRGWKNRTALHSACISGRVDMVRYLLHKDIALLACGSAAGSTPLHKAAEYNQMTVIKALVGEFSCDTTVTNERGETAAMIAERKGYPHITKYLNYKALGTAARNEPEGAKKISEENTEGDTSKGRQAPDGASEKISENDIPGMLKQMSKYSQFSCNRESGEAGKELLQACEDGNMQMIRGITDKHLYSCCDPSDNDCTPLHKASLHGHLKVVKYLVEEQKCDVACRDNFRSTPLHYACKGGKLDIVQYLIEERKSAPMSQDDYGRTPLHYAARNGKFKAVKYLMDIPNVDSTMKDKKNGSTPLHEAAEFGSKEIVSYMIDKHNNDSSCKNDKRNTPLHQAAFGGNLDTMTYLVNIKKCHPEAEGWRKRTPLHDACKKGRLQAAEYLLKECKVNPACRDEKDATPLHMAALHGHLPIVKLLVDDFMCNPCVVSRSGETPLDCAQREGHAYTNIVDYLLLKMDVIDTIKLNVTPGKPLDYIWEGYGFKLHIPADALTGDPITMKIDACLGGCYTLPDDWDLVTGVYQISFPCKFERPAKLTIQHNACPKEGSALSFVAAKCTNGLLPYQFKTLSGGNFSENDGIIEIKDFSRVAAGANNNVSKVYWLKVYHLPYEVRKLSWITRITITVNLKMHITYLDSQYAKRGCEKDGPGVVVQFAGNEVISLVGIHKEMNNGWSISARSSYHTDFTKSVVDTCVRDKSEMPFVELRLTWEGPEPPPEALKHRIDVIGIEGTAFLDLGRNIHQPNAEGDINKGRQAPDGASEKISENDIPGMLKQMSKYSQRDYKDALEKGSENITYIRVMFIGKEGSGKSSTLDGLMGLHFKEGKDSTTLAEQKSLKYEWIKSEKGKGIWTQHSNDDEKNELAKLSCRAASKSDKSQSSTSSNTENEPTINEMKTTEGESTTDLEDIPTSEVESDATAEAHYNEHTDEISKKAMQQDIEENSSCESLDVLHVWDCGGQPVFLDILSVFITIRTFFLLFFNASEDIHAPCEESVWRHKSQQFTGRKRNITNIQLLIQWMQLIYGTVSVSQKQAHLSIMVVGTHGDKITSNKDTVLQSIELACRGKAFSKIASKGVIVNNTTAGTEVEDPGYGIIRKNAHAFAKELTTPTPLTWISFRLMVLKTIKEKGKRLYKLSKEKVTEIANSCNITNVDSVLEFYHQLGVFLYFPQSSPATVFVDPHWLFQQLCQLLIPDPSSIAQQNLTMYGILSSDMYQKVSKHCGLGEETLVEILDEFDLAKKIPVSQAPVDMTGKKLFFCALHAREHIKVLWNQTKSTYAQQHYI